MLKEAGISSQDLFIVCRWGLPEYRVLATGKMFAIAGKYSVCRRAAKTNEHDPI